MWSAALPGSAATQLAALSPLFSHAERARGNLRRPSSFLIRVNPSDPSNPCSIPAGVGGPWPEHIQGAVKKAQV